MKTQDSSPSSSSSSFAVAPPFCPSSSNSSSSINQSSRCEGLDLLVKAVFHLREPIFFCIPFTQKKVIRRRKRAFRFEKTLVSNTEKEDSDQKLVAIKKETETETELMPNPQRQKRVMALPSKYQDSVLQPWKRRTRQTR